ncbi:MAG: hypothetical protein ABI591_04240 [Kofleriaceae bacterium]
MTYFADLTPYVYGPDDGWTGDLNIGWIAKTIPYAHGSPPEGLVTALITCAARPVRLYRGVHECELCGERDLHFDLEGREVHVGNGELRVHDANGQAYTAPTLVVHYVEAHGYLPPAPFIEGVMRWAKEAFIVKGRLLEQLYDASPAELHQRCLTVLGALAKHLGVADSEAIVAAVVEGRSLPSDLDPRIVAAAEAIDRGFAKTVPKDRRTQVRLWTITQLLEDAAELGVDVRTD